MNFSLHPHTTAKQFKHFSLVEVNQSDLMNTRCYLYLGNHFDSSMLAHIVVSSCYLYKELLLELGLTMKQKS